MLFNLCVSKYDQLAQLFELTTLPPRSPACVLLLFPPSVAPSLSRCLCVCAFYLLSRVEAVKNAQADRKKTSGGRQEETRPAGRKKGMDKAVKAKRSESHDTAVPRVIPRPLCHSGSTLESVANHAGRTAST